MLATDWSGDPSFKVGDGASRYFSLSLVHYSEDEIHAILKELRKQQKLPPYFEYHFAKGPSKTQRVRQGFMQALTNSHISGFVAALDKKALPQEMTQFHGVDFIADQLCSLVLRLPDEQIDGAMLLVDGEKKDTRPLCTVTKRRFRQRADVLQRACHLEDVKSAESHRNDGIMVADMLAGAAQHAAKGAEPDFLAPLRRKITVIRSP